MSKGQLSLSKIIFILIVFILLARLVAGLNRYFDADEFAHLHWTYLLSQGSLPYKNFFIYHVPFFQFSLLPLFLLPPGPDILLSARILMWLVYVSVVFFLYKFAYLVTKNKTTSMLAAFILTVFPMTFDKSLEVRPDMLMVLFFLVTVFLLIHASKTKLILSGLFYSLAVFTFPKILFSLPALAILLLAENRQTSRGTLAKNFIIILLGGSIPLLFFLLYLLLNKILPEAGEAVIYSSFIISANTPSFSPLLALSPYPLVYLSLGGVSLPWIINTLIVSGTPLGLIILLSEKNKFAFFFLYFFICALAFLFLFPLPYLQYFVPLSVFVSLLSAIFIGKAVSLFNKKIFSGIFISSITAILFFSFWQQYQVRSTASSANTEQLAVVKNILKVSKPDETFFDLIGSYVFRPDGYFICCHPYYDFVDKLNVKPPTLTNSLITNQTKFIVMDRTGQVFWKPLPEDLAFLTTHFLPSAYPKIYTLGTKFTCQNGSCMQTDLNGNQISDRPHNQLDVVVREKYKITTDPPNQVVSIDDRRVITNIITLSKSSHSFTVSPKVTNLTVQLSR